jgi:hypothetical protein
VRIAHCLMHISLPDVVNGGARNWNIVGAATFDRDTLYAHVWIGLLAEIVNCYYILYYE